MTVIKVDIECLSPLHLSSGQADVTMDAEVIHDAFGMPYFPAKRFKGLLYESALEVVEMSELCGAVYLERGTVEKLFQRVPDSPVQMIIHDFYLAGYAQMRKEWRYLQEKYAELLSPMDVLESYTSIRYQTAIDADTGIAARSSLHNMRVVDAGLHFIGEIGLQVSGGDADVYKTALAMALRNLSAAGLKRNRGFGQMKCVMDDMDALIERAISREDD